MAMLFHQTKKEKDTSYAKSISVIVFRKVFIFLKKFFLRYTRYCALFRIQSTSCSEFVKLARNYRGHQPTLADLMLGQHIRWGSLCQQLLPTDIRELLSQSNPCQSNALCYSSPRSTSASSIRSSLSLWREIQFSLIGFPGNFSTIQGRSSLPKKSKLLLQKSVYFSIVYISSPSRLI